MKIRVFRRIETSSEVVKSCFFPSIARPLGISDLVLVLMQGEESDKISKQAPRSNLRLASVPPTCLVGWWRSRLVTTRWTALNRIVSVLATTKPNQV